ncbi:MAG: Crp/Fnr family transcriptional regulator [FCB group bacterium]|nr:Crp/Fnr family transcriptional regulator [FCB group bacterium]
MYHALEDIPLFEKLKASDLSLIAQYVVFKKYKRNEILLREGDPGHQFCILKKGKAKVFRINERSQEIILAFLHDGDFFGELSILDECECCANVRAQQNCEVLCIKGHHFKKLIRCIPELSYQLLAAMSMRLKASNQCVKNLNGSASTRRIGNILLQYAEEYGYRCKGSVIIKKIPFQHEIAGLAGTSRETVSRTITKLKNDKYIIKNGRQVVICEYQRFYEDFSS